MSNTRVTVVVRRDLQMSAGLLAAQVAHIASQRVHNKIIGTRKNSTVASTFNKEELDWMSTPYLSVLAVECVEDLEEVKKAAVEAGLPVTDWHDLVPSPTFEGEVIPNAFVGIAIGPDDFDAIKAVTVRLSLY